MSLPIRLNLDVGQMRACLGLWRESLMIDDGHAEGGSDRRTLLARTDRALDGWLDLLRLCSAEGSEQQRLAEITKEVEAFREWTREAGFALSLMTAASNTSRDNGGSHGSR